MVGWVGLKKRETEMDSALEDDFGTSCTGTGSEHSHQSSRVGLLESAKIVIFPQKIFCLLSFANKF